MSARSGVPGAVPTGRDTNPWVVLFVLTAGIFMLLLDTTIVNVAQQAIRESLDASLTEIQWILDAYILTFAVLLLTFGRLGDVFGRKRFFIIGMTIFTIGSALSGSVELMSDATGISGADLLIFTRVVQGIGGAFMMPQTLSMITVVFPPERRGAAMGIWGGVTALGAVVGPIIGGLIVTNYDWEWIFLINVPIGVAAIIASIILLPESTDPEATHQLDYLGILFSAGAIFALTFALIEGQGYGWTDPLILGCFIASVVLGVAFVWWEARVSQPMMPISLFKIRNFWTANVITLITSFGLFGIFFPLTIFLQGILGNSAIRAGMTMVPMAVTIMIVAPIAGRLSDKIGARWLLVGGLSTATVGLALLSIVVSPDADWQTFFIPLMIVGIGLGSTFPPMTSAAMREVPPRISGSASGVINTVRNIGQVLGIAILGTMLQVWATNISEEKLQPIPIDDALKSQLADYGGQGLLVAVPQAVPAADQSQLPAIMSALQEAFSQAMQQTFYICVVALLLGAATALLVRNIVETKHPAGEPVQEAVPVGD